MAGCTFDSVVSWQGRSVRYLVSPGQISEVTDGNEHRIWHVTVVRIELSRQLTPRLLSTRLQNIRQQHGEEMHGEIDG